MKKLCAKQNRRAKQWEFSQSVRKLFAMCCEFRNAKNHSEFRNAKFRNAKFRNAKNHSEFRNAKLVANLAANLATNLAMRIFAKVLHFCVRQMNSVLWLQNFAMRNSQCEVGHANFAMPNGCELFANSLRKFLFCFFFSLLIFNICSKICTKLLKLKQEKLHKGTN